MKNTKITEFKGRTFSDVVKQAKAKGIKHPVGNLLRRDGFYRLRIVTKEATQ